MSIEAINQLETLVAKFATDDRSKKLELCTNIVDVLNSSSFSNVSEDIFSNLRLGIRDMLQSRLSNDLRKQVATLLAALFDVFGSSWLDFSEESQVLLVLITNISSIEIRVSLSNDRNDYHAVKAYSDVSMLLLCLRCLRGCIVALGKWIECSAGIDSNRIMQIFGCFHDVMKEVLPFVENSLLTGDYETDRAARNLLENFVLLVTQWKCSDTQTLTKEWNNVLPQIIPIVTRYQWNDAAINIVTFLDMIDSEGVMVVSGSSDERDFGNFSLQTMLDRFDELMKKRDERLLHVLHYHVTVVADVREPSEPQGRIKAMLPLMVRRGISKVSTSITRVERQKQIAFESQCLLYLAVLGLKLYDPATLTTSVADGNPVTHDESMQDDDVFIVSATQVMWAFVGFSQHLKDGNKFHLVSSLKSLEADSLDESLDIWATGVELLTKLIQFYPRILAVLNKFGFLDRAVIIPLMDTLEMPDECEKSLENFFAAVAAVSPELGESNEILREERLIKRITMELTTSDTAAGAS